MQSADSQLKDIKEASDKMTPEDRVSFTMELQEDVAEKVKTIKELVEKETSLLPQGQLHHNKVWIPLFFFFIGDKCPQDAEDYKAELKRVQDFVLDLQKRVMTECDNFSEDVKFWAEYKTGIKEFK